MTDNTTIEFFKKGRIEINAKFWDGEYRTTFKGGKKDYANFRIYAFEIPVKETEDEKENNERSPSKGDAFLSVKITYYYEEDKSKIEVSGSWRKWYFSKGSTRDLNYPQTFKLLHGISTIIGVSLVDILKAKFLYIELGYNIWFNKRIIGLSDGFVYYKGWKKSYRYDHESVKWSSGIYSVGLYDKIEEVMSEVHGKPYLAKKLRKKKTCLRYEVSFEEVPKAPKGLKNYLSSVGNYLNHWNDCMRAINEIYEDIEFVPYVVPVGFSHLKGKSKAEFEIYKTFIVAGALGGVENYLAVMNELDSKNSRKYIRNEAKTLNAPPFFIKRMMKECETLEKDLRVARSKKVTKLLESKFR